MSLIDRTRNALGSWGPALAVIAAFLLGVLVWLALTGHNARDYEVRSPIVLKSDQVASSKPTLAESDPDPTGTGETGAGASPPGFGITVQVGPEDTGASFSVVATGGRGDASSAASEPSDEPSAPSASSDIRWFTGDGWQFLGWVVILLAAAGLFWKIFEYLNGSRDDYYREHGKLVKLGWTPEPKSAPAILYLDLGGNALSTEDAKADPSSKAVGLEINGPDKVEAGSVAFYTIIPDSGLPLVGSYAVVPEPKIGIVKAHRVDPTTGEVAIEALKPGKVNLTIEVGGILTKGELSIEVMPKVAPQPSKSMPLMVFGTGSHTLILVTLVMFVLLMLTLSGAVAGAIVAPLIGTLIGYLFGVKSDAGEETPEAPKAPEADTTPKPQAPKPPTP